MQEIDRKKLEAAIKRDYPYMDETLCAFHAKKILTEMDQRLYHNISQWIEGEKLDGDMIGDYCIDKILQIRESRDFLSALDAMNLYLKDARAGEQMIWRSRR